MSQEEIIWTGISFLDELDECDNLETTFELIKSEIENSDFDSDSFLAGYGEECWGMRSIIIDSEIVYGEMTSKYEGWLSLEFVVFFNSGCVTYDKRDEKNMELKISVNPQTGDITLTGEEFFMREPDEY